MKDYLSSILIKKKKHARLFLAIATAWPNCKVPRSIVVTYRSCAGKTDIEWGFHWFNGIVHGDLIGINISVVFPVGVCYGLLSNFPHSHLPKSFLSIGDTSFCDGGI